MESFDLARNHTFYQRDYSKEAVWDAGKTPHRVAAQEAREPAQTPDFEEPATDHAEHALETTLQTNTILPAAPYLRHQVLYALSDHPNRIEW